jgi:uncharacterized protein YndB with AHSA1/START domain
MDQPSVVHATFVIEQGYRVGPDRRFAAFAEPDRKRAWYAQGETHTVRDYRMDFRVGGVEEWDATFDASSPFPGAVLASRGVILDIVPDARIVIASDMRISEHRFSVSLITVEILAAGEGSRLVFTHQGAFFEGADGPEMREEGWRQLLGRLQAMLEPSREDA